MPFASIPRRCRPEAAFALSGLAALLLISSTVSGDEPAVTRLAEGLKNPESVAIGADGTIYVSTIGKFDTDGDGEVVAIKDGKVVSFAMGLDDPKGLVAFQQWLFVADKTRVLRIDLKTKKKI